MMNASDSSMAANAICHAAEMTRERMFQAIYTVEEAMVQQARESAVSLRDRFAMAALQGVVVGVDNPNEEECAALAYRLADAMLVAREPKP